MTNIFCFTWTAVPIFHAWNFGIVPIFHNSDISWNTGVAAAEAMVTFSSGGFGDVIGVSGKIMWECSQWSELNAIKSFDASPSCLFEKDQRNIPWNVLSSTFSPVTSSLRESLPWGIERGPLAKGNFRCVFELVLRGRILQSERAPLLKSAVTKSY